jgi:hypothetical protein
VSGYERRSVRVSTLRADHDGGLHYFAPEAVWPGDPELSNSDRLGVLIFDEKVP